MTATEKIQALINEGGYTRDEAVELLIDMGELNEDGEE